MKRYPNLIEKLPIHKVSNKNHHRQAPAVMVELVIAELKVVLVVAVNIQQKMLESTVGLSKNFVFW